MNLIVSSIVEYVNEHNIIVNSVGVDDWTAKMWTITSNEFLDQIWSRRKFLTSIPETDLHSNVMY